MKQHLALVAIVVRDYDEALSWYTEKLGFRVVENRDDSIQGPGRRWVVVAPAGSTGAAFLLAKASNEQQKEAIGNQTGGRVFLFLHTDDFERDYRAYVGRGVTFVREPSSQPYCRLAVFTDLYGNRWDLIQPAVSA